MAFGSRGASEVATVSVDRLLALLPDRVRAYQAAVASDDLAAEERSRIDLCSVFEYLLGAHLGGSREWEPGAWVDGVLPGTLDMTEPGVVSVAGLAVWRGRRGWFLDPFAGRAELAACGSSVQACSLRFGDAGCGFGKFPYVPYSKHRFDPPPTSWLFAFDSAPDAERGAAPDRRGR
jgi:hypothetical protein